MELLRLGKVDVRLLREISERFQYLDILGVGQITKETMHAGLMFEKLDDDNRCALAPCTRACPITCSLC